MPGPVAPVPCPECTGPMWDNTTDPKRKANQPHYRCKNRKNCDGAIWLKGEELEAAAARSSAGAPAPARPNAPARAPLTLEKVMDAALDAAIELSKKFKDGDVEGADHDITLRMAQSLFIARVDGKGIFALEKKALAERAKKAAEAAEAARKAAAEAETRRREEERARQASQPQVGAGASGTYGDPYADFPSALEDQDDDLPF